MYYSIGFGVLSTNSKKLEGYPNGSVVGFGLDPKGRPLFAFSTMSSHTTDLAAGKLLQLHSQDGISPVTEHLLIPTTL